MGVFLSACRSDSASPVSDSTNTIGHWRDDGDMRTHAKGSGTRRRAVTALRAIHLTGLRSGFMSVLQPRAGVHYPRSAGEFRSWFGSDEDCLDYLDWLRWPDGFVCP